MNGGHRLKYFDRGLQLRYRHSRRGHRGGRSVLQAPGVTPALSEPSLAQFMTGSGLLGQPLYATSLGDTVMDLSAFLPPDWWSSETPRRGFLTPSPVTWLAHASRRRHLGFKGAKHQSAPSDPSLDAAPASTDTLSGACDHPSRGSHPGGALEPVHEPSNIIKHIDPSRDRLLPIPGGPRPVWPVLATSALG